jgi:hypothetical protein
VLPGFLLRIYYNVFVCLSIKVIGFRNQQDYVPVGMKAVVVQILELRPEVLRSNLPNLVPLLVVQKMVNSEEESWKHFRPL